MGENFDVSLAKQFFLISSVVITGFYLSISKLLVERKLTNVEAQRIALISNLKQSLLLALENLTNEPQMRDSVNIRIWKEYKGLICCFSNCLRRFKGKPPKKFIVIKNIEGLSNIDNTIDLKFLVEPKNDSQGLVGRCFHEKAIVYEEDLMSSDIDYRLNTYQRNKTNETRFCLCSPIVNEKDEVVSIISFDSSHRIVLPEDNELRIASLATTFCQSLYQNCPDLFK